MSLQKGIKVEKMRKDLLKSFSYEGHRPIYATKSIGYDRSITRRARPPLKLEKK